VEEDKMIRYDGIDLALDDDGDLLLDETGDFALSKDYDCAQDDIFMAVNTQKNDSDVFPEFGADLEELIGLPNTREMAMDGAGRIAETLITNNIVNSGDLSVIPLPVGDEIIYYIVVETPEGRKIYDVPLNTVGLGG
jgi:hypothetical protein